MQNRLREPSSSTVDQVHRRPERQLTKWRRRLSERQVDEILTVVDEVGLSRFYTDAIEPDYDRLNACQAEPARWDAQATKAPR
jgi:phosphopantothenate synthetase